jgi:glycosyltransferase involved in cell wall biosynthesis
VTILGYVSNGNIAYLYKHAVGMVMPSYFGPTNIPPLEAMLLGCPVAVSDKYAMPEQVGNAGLLFNPDSPEEIASCIEKLWMDENLRERLKKLGYKRVKQWNKEKFNKRLLKVVKEVEQVKI